MTTFNKKIITAAVALVSAGSVLLASGSALAGLYGTEITIYDGTLNDGYGSAKEDNEAEQGMVQSQVWDLEGFLLKEKALTIVGGYNFYTGQERMMAGDIFIDTNGDAVVSPNLIPNFHYDPYERVTNDKFKYDFVLDINWTNSTYDIIALNANSILVNTEYGDSYNKPSNPWKYDEVLNNPGSKLNTTSLSFNTYGKISKSDTGFLQWGVDNKHFVATFDLSLIDLSNGALFHNTMECGNDNLLGRSAPVPEPATMLLFGTGLAGLAAAIRRKNNA